jgi:hypothetical protein
LLLPELLLPRLLLPELLLPELLLPELLLPRLLPEQAVHNSLLACTLKLLRPAPPCIRSRCFTVRPSSAGAASFAPLPFQLDLSLSSCLAFAVAAISQQNVVSLHLKQRASLIPPPPVYDVFIGTLLFGFRKK